jgi:5'-nucleotidase
MRILITNDDGVGAEQLLPLIKWCQKLGDVTTFVPKFEQSGKSHGFEIHKPFEVKQVELEPGITVWTVDSTPADCVRFAVIGLGQTFDLVISGVNRGLNLGHDSMYSGTFAAACEAVNNGMKALALSTTVKAYDRSTEHLDEIFTFVEEHRLLQRNSLYNINIPAEPKGIRITRQGGPYFIEDFQALENDMYLPVGKPIGTESTDLTLDTAAHQQGYISISPMTTDRTNQTVFHRLLQLNT